MSRRRLRKPKARLEKKLGVLYDKVNVNEIIHKKAVKEKNHAGYKIFKRKPGNRKTEHP